MRTGKSNSTFLRWSLFGGLVVVVAAADWHAGGVLPQLVLGTATLNLTSAPGEATVFLDGKSVGRTPLRDRRVLPGGIVIRMEHRFHDAVARRVEAGRDDVVDIHVEFPPSWGSLEVVTNPRGARVAVDGEDIGDVTPIVLTPHPTGTFEVATWMHGRERKTEAVEILPRQHTEVAFELERVPMSEIHVSRIPRDAELEIEGKPYRPGMTLPIGTYRLTARRSGYAPVDRTIEFTRGRNDRSIVLERLKGSLSVIVRPARAEVEVSYPLADAWHKRPYREGMIIPTGPVLIRATALGHRPYERQLTMGPTTLKHVIRMEAYDIRPGRRFRDKLASGGEGPLLVIVGTGRFRMGSETGPSDERPVRTVAIKEPFAIAVFETTRDEYDRYRAARGMPAAVSKALEPEDAIARESTGGLPMTRLAWEDGRDYVRWLTEETGYRYRLPSEAEWEYVARAGSTGEYYFGIDPKDLCAHANIADKTYASEFKKADVADCTDGRVRWASVGSFSANSFGVYDILGNVEEWVADCWRDNYRNAPSDQRARTGGCTTHVLRGGAWDSSPREVTVSYRSLSDRGSSTRGVRVVREL
ncbi:MAG: SUMF1/EgtB/PvdO family nonheme iron enzyme [Gammaproteobacteria bacterium]|nr:SUMF1/EgtB/PvdO family nonheme iron enzyme [Gammaproteobacteria bacterium]